MTRKVSQSPVCVGLLSIAGALWLFAPNTAAGQTAEAFYVSDVDSIVQGKCITCHVSGGQAGGTELRFTSSASSNHSVIDSFVNSPTKGARASRVLSKITGGLGHGGGQVISQGSVDYQTFSDYMDLLTLADEPGGDGSEEVLRVSLEEPINGETHMGVGNLRGWAVASSGIHKIEVLLDGAYLYDAPYGGSRGDVGKKFPEIQNSGESGFSLAYNYSGLSFGEHTFTVVAHTELGETKEASATFNVVRFDKSFISDPDGVSFDGASCSLEADAVNLSDVNVDGGFYDLRLIWRKSEQGLEIVEIR